MYKADVVADSISDSGVRLITWLVRFPRFLLAQMNTHRVFSRSYRSSRAVGVGSMITEVEESPFIPDGWRRNKRGMQTDDNDCLEGEAAERMSNYYNALRASALQTAKLMQVEGVAKEQINRILEPYSWVTGIISSTETENFFALRCHGDAQSEMRIIAEMMLQSMRGSTPTRLSPGDWHLPFVTDEERELFKVDVLLKVSAGRCARVSYGKEGDVGNVMSSLRLAGRLLDAGHMSPFEHQAQAMHDETDEYLTPNGSIGLRTYEYLRSQTKGGIASSVVWVGNFRGWEQYRKMLPNESVFTHK
jgi:thymidylate synthase ThyX